MDDLVNEIIKEVLSNSRIIVEDGNRHIGYDGYCEVEDITKLKGRLKAIICDWMDQMADKHRD